MGGILIVSPFDKTVKRRYRGSRWTVAFDRSVSASRCLNIDSLLKTSLGLFCVLSTTITPRSPKPLGSAHSSFAVPQFSSAPELSDA